MAADNKANCAGIDQAAAGTDEKKMPLAAWKIACIDVDRATQQAGVTRVFDADAGECAAIADALDLNRCTMAKATVTVRARAGGRYVLQGRLQARIEQLCVVTLEPLSAQIDEPLACEFCPASDLPALGTQDPNFDPDDEDEPLAIIDGALPVGQYIYEQLALAIDPFPRAAGAEDIDLERGPGGPAAAGQSPRGGVQNPFAVLAKLKPGQTD